MTDHELNLMAANHNGGRFEDIDAYEADEADRELERRRILSLTRTIGRGTYTPDER